MFFIKNLNIPYKFYLFEKENLETPNSFVYLKLYFLELNNRINFATLGT